MMNSDTSIVPREMMSLRGIPSIVINPEGIRISKIAYDTLGGKQRVLFRLNKNKRRLAVLRNEKLKDHSSDFLPEIEGWEPEDVVYNLQELSQEIYSLMGWKESLEYKLFGYEKDDCGINALLFNLSEFYMHSIQNSQLK